MANLFEKPIAANPMSRFVAMPLDFMQNALQQKQNRYDKARADMDVLEDSLLKTNALTGDRERQQAILKGYDDEISAIAETGDLSNVQGQLDSLKRKMSRDMAYGELGAINSNFSKASKYSENIGKLYSANKIKGAGRDLSMKSISDFKTTPNGDGSYATFSGYTPSNLTNPLKSIRDSIKAIHAKYDEEGQEFVDENTVISNLNNEIVNNPEILNSMRESFMASYGGDNSKEDFAKYYNKTILDAVRDATYKKKLTAAQKGKNSGANKEDKITRGRQWGKFAIPKGQGELDATGMNASTGRSILDYLGFNMTDKFKEYVKSKEGQREIKFLEGNSETPFPENYMDQVDWIEENASKPVTGELITINIPNYMSRNVISDKGERLTNGAVWDQNGNVVNKKDQNAIFGDDGAGKVATVVGMSGQDSAHPYGSIVFIGKDGNTYVQENLDTEILGSPEYAKSLINSTRYSTTGKKPITFTRPIIGNGGITLAQGSYQSVYDQDTGIVDLYQNGILKYRYGKDSNGNDKIIKVDNKPVDDTEGLD